MTPIEDFMARYFRERTELIAVEIERRLPYRRKYFTEECSWESRRGAVEASRAEQILAVSQHAEEALVVTSGDTVKIPSGETTKEVPFQRRYRLRPSGETWLIHKVEVMCLACKGTGKTPAGHTCPLCKGHLWK